MAETTKRFLTSGMHCGSCSMLVDMTLGDTQGVISSKTDHANGESMVTFDDAVIDADGVIAAIRGAGYEASLAE